MTEYLKSETGLVNKNKMQIGVDGILLYPELSNYYDAVVDWVDKAFTFESLTVVNQDYFKTSLVAIAVTITEFNRKKIHEIATKDVRSFCKALRFFHQKSKPSSRPTVSLLFYYIDIIGKKVSSSFTMLLLFNCGSCGQKLSFTALEDKYYCENYKCKSTLHLKAAIGNPTELSLNAEDEEFREKVLILIHKIMESNIYFIEECSILLSQNFYLSRFESSIYTMQINRLKTVFTYLCELGAFGLRVLQAEESLRKGGIDLNTLVSILDTQPTIKTAQFDIEALRGS